MRQRPMASMSRNMALHKSSRSKTLSRRRLSLIQPNQPSMNKQLKAELKKLAEAVPFRPFFD
jgi:hypothetical protein